MRMRVSPPNGVDADVVRRVRGGRGHVGDDAEIVGDDPLVAVAVGPAEVLVHHLADAQRVRPLAGDDDLLGVEAFGVVLADETEESGRPDADHGEADGHVTGRRQIARARSCPHSERF